MPQIQKILSFMYMGLTFWEKEQNEEEEERGKGACEGRSSRRRKVVCKSGLEDKFLKNICFLHKKEITIKMTIPCLAQRIALGTCLFLFLLNTS